MRKSLVVLNMTYANTTNVSSERTKAEIETLLQKYGANQFISGWRDKEALFYTTLDFGILTQQHKTIS